MDTNFLADIHPQVVHFPIALLTTYAILEIVGILANKEFISKSALLILCLGVFTALLAVLTGYQAATEFNSWTEVSSSLLSIHQSYATYLMWISAIICGLRLYFVIRKKFVGYIRYGFLFLPILILFLVIQTGLHGGNLVKKFGVGTNYYQNYENK